MSRLQELDLTLSQHLDHLQSLVFNSPLPISTSTPLRSAFRSPPLLSPSNSSSFSFLGVPPFYTTSDSSLLDSDMANQTNLVEALAELRTPPKFSGADPSQIDNFFLQFETTANQYGWDDAKRKSMLASCFSGSALDYYYYMQGTPTFEAKTYAQVKEDLLKTFRGFASPYRVEELIQKRKQGLTEPAHTYVLSKARMIKTYKPETPEQHVVASCVLGLRSDLLTQLVDKVIPTVADLLTQLQILDRKRVSVYERTQEELKEYQQLSHDLQSQPVSVPVSYSYSHPAPVQHVSPSPAYTWTSPSVVPQPLNPTAQAFQPANAALQDLQKEIAALRASLATQKQSSGEQHPPQASGTDVANSEMAKLCNKMGQLVLQLSNGNESQPQQPYQGNPRKRPNYNDQSRRQSKPTSKPSGGARKPIQCYRCNGFNHIQRNCLASPSSGSQNSAGSRNTQNTHSGN